MKLLEDRILKDGKVLEGNILRVDSFVNHMMDTVLMDELAKEMYNRYKDCKVTKVLTVEASGIGFAYAVARLFACPMVFAKKSRSSNVQGDVYTSPVDSFTHGKTYNIIVSKDYITKDDSVLVIDDFLALGNALKGLISILEQAGASLVGAGTIIEKGYQKGGDGLREKGVRVESLAIIDEMDGKNIKFRPEN